MLCCYLSLYFSLRILAGMACIVDSHECVISYISLMQAATLLLLPRPQQLPAAAAVLAVS